MADSTIGFSVDGRFSEAVFTLGDVVSSSDGEFVFVHFSEACDAGEVCILTAENDAQPLTLTLAMEGFGRRLGVPLTAFAAGEYGALMVRGEVDIEAAANATARTQLYATATAGQIDITEEDGGALSGVVLTEDAGMVSGRVRARLLNPVAGAATGSGGGGGSIVGAASIRAGDTITNLYDGEVAVANNYNPLAAGVDVPQDGYVRIYAEVRGGTNRDGGVASATLPAARLYAAQRSTGDAPSADQADNRTVPIGANRFLAFARDAAAGSDALMVSPQDGNTDGTYYFKIDHIMPGEEVDLVTTTPTQEGSSYTAGLTTNLADTGVELPDDGWIWVEGEAFGTGNSVRIPVSRISDKAASTAGTAASTANSYHVQWGDGDTHIIRLGYIQDGNILIAGGVASAISDIGFHV